VAVDHDFNSEFPNSTSRMGKRVIYINPVTMESEKWDLYLKDTKTRLLAGEEINNLVSFIVIFDSIFWLINVFD
jgi:DNA cross-link repair 1C protein